MSPEDFKDTVRLLVERAKERSGTTSNAALGELIGVRGQTIANSCSQSRKQDMLSKPVLDQLMVLAEYSEQEVFEFVERWLQWKLERSNDGGVAEYLLGILRKRMKKKDMRDVIETAAEMRHKADRSGR